MKNQTPQLVFKTVVIMFVFMTFSTAGATEIFFSVEGTQSGKFVGESTQAGFEGQIPAVKYEYELSNHQLVKLTKRMGPASTSFFNAHRVKEGLTVTIDFFRPHRSGKRVATHRMTLKNAKVVSIKQYSEPLGQALLVLDELSLAFGDSEMKDMLGGTSSPNKAPRKFRR